MMSGFIHDLRTVTVFEAAMPNQPDNPRLAGFRWPPVGWLLSLLGLSLQQWTKRRQQMKILTLAADSATCHTRGVSRIAP